MPPKANPRNHRNNPYLLDDLEGYRKLNSKK